MKYNECEIINDLLPNYISKLTTNETNGFIEKHLDECSKCKNVYEAMKKDISLDDINKEKLQINGFKKINKKLKFLKIFIIVLLIVLLTLSIRFSIYMLNGYRVAVQNTIDLFNSLDNANTFYATIEEIESSGLDHSILLTIKGLDINSYDYRGEYKISVVEDMQNLIWHGNKIKITDFKVGQTISIISAPIRHGNDEQTQIRKIEILDDNL